MGVGSRWARLLLAPLPPVASRWLRWLPLAPVGSGWLRWLPLGPKKLLFGVSHTQTVTHIYWEILARGPPLPYFGSRVLFEHPSQRPQRTARHILTCQKNPYIITIDKHEQLGSSAKNAYIKRILLQRRLSWMALVHGGVAHGAMMSSERPHQWGLWGAYGVRGAQRQPSRTPHRSSPSSRRLS